MGLTLPDQYELVDNLVAYDRPWKTLPLADIKVKTDSNGDLGDCNAILGEGIDLIMFRHAYTLLCSSC